MFGQRLRLARKKAGLSMRALSEQVSPKVSAQAISKYESGKMLPSSAVLVGLGKTLGVSLDYLMGSKVVELKEIKFRKHSKTSARDRITVEAIVTEKIENYLVIEDILDLAPLEDPFGELFTESVASLEQIDDLAEALRQRWSLGIDPITSMTGLLEDKGIRIIEADLPPRFDGLACDVVCIGETSSTAVVVVSTQTSVERKRFNLAHELGHRVIRPTGLQTIQLERAINRFAGAFLVPAEHLKELAGRQRRHMANNELVSLKRLYGVSAEAMLVRLNQTRVLTYAYTKRAIRSYSRDWCKEESEPIQDDEGFGSLERPQRFERLVWRALSEQLIAPIRAAQLLGVSLSSVERAIQGPRG